MATGSSARRAPSLSKQAARLLGWLLGLSGLLSGCAGEALRLAAGTPGLEETAGVLRYQGAPVTGTVFELRRPGDTLAITPYVQGKAQGMARAWYGPGRLREVRRYVAGREEGLVQGWWENGRRHYRRWFRAGQYHGAVLEWYANGQLYQRGHFTAGQEAGRQQFWQPDGTLRANYEARDGRQYGFIGSKYCVTPTL